MQQRNSGNGEEGSVEKPVTVRTSSLCEAYLALGKAGSVLSSLFSHLICCALLFCCLHVSRMFKNLQMKPASKNNAGRRASHALWFTAHSV